MAWIERVFFGEFLSLFQISHSNFKRDHVEKVYTAATKKIELPRTSLSSLALMSPTDPRFLEATASDDPVFPVTETEQATVNAIKGEADARAKAGDYSGAESLVPEYKRRMAHLGQMKKVFCLVLDCEKDARAAHDMEMKAVQLRQPRFLWMIWSNLTSMNSLPRFWTAWRRNCPNYFFMLAGPLISVESLALPNTMLLWLGSCRGFKLPPLLNHHRLHWSPCLSSMKRQQHEREAAVESWENDPTEKARRIWEWWKARLSAYVRFWPTALRLVVLVQPSSAFVERVFSQIKLILEQTGVSGLEESIEARVLVRCC
jgi:hypothetical protein